MANLPSGYTELLYIESTGTQYIDTHYNANANTVWELNASFAQKNDAEQKMGIQGRSGYASRCAVGVLAADTMYYGIGEENYDSDIARDGEAHTYIVDVSNFNATYDDNIISVGTKYQQNPITSLVLFGVKNGSTDTIDTARYCKAKLYYSTISENGEVIHEYVPAMNSSNVVGLYDITTNTFKTNNGTGTFLYGEIPAPSTLPVYINNVAIEKFYYNNTEISKLFYNDVQVFPSVPPAPTNLLDASKITGVRPCSCYGNMYTGKYLYREASISNIANMFDDDDTTYATAISACQKGTALDTYYFTSILIDMGEEKTITGFKYNGQLYDNLNSGYPHFWLWKWNAPPSSSQIDNYNAVATKIYDRAYGGRGYIKDSINYTFDEPVVGRYFVLEIPMNNFLGSTDRNINIYNFQLIGN